MTRFRNLAGIAAIMLLAAAGGASGQNLATPEPPPGEQPSRMLLQAVGNQREAAQRAVEAEKGRAIKLVDKPLGHDVDLYLSNTMEGFEQTEIDIAQMTLGLASDPQLRRLARETITVVAEQIVKMREWQLRRQPQQGQAEPAAVSGDDSEIRAGVEAARAEVAKLFERPIGEDVDLSLSELELIFQQIEIDMAQVILTRAVDPELRVLAEGVINLAAERISNARNWQTSQDLLQQEIVPIHQR